MVRLSKHNYMPMFATASSLFNNIFSIIVGVMLSTAKAGYPLAGERCHCNRPMSL